MVRGGRRGSSIWSIELRHCRCCCRRRRQWCGCRCGSMVKRMRMVTHGRRHGMVPSSATVAKARDGGLVQILLAVGKAVEQRRARERGARSLQRMRELSHHPKRVNNAAGTTPHHTKRFVLAAVAIAAVASREVRTERRLASRLVHLGPRARVVHSARVVRVPGEAPSRERKQIDTRTSKRRMSSQLTEANNIQTGSCPSQSACRSVHSSVVEVHTSSWLRKGSDPR